MRRSIVDNFTYRSVDALDQWRHTASAIVSVALVNIRAVVSVASESRGTGAAPIGSWGVHAIHEGILRAVRCLRETFILIRCTLRGYSVGGPSLIADALEGGATLNAYSMATQFSSAIGTIQVLSGAVNSLEAWDISISKSNQINWRVRIRLPLAQMQLYPPCVFWQEAPFWQPKSVPEKRAHSLTSSPQVAP